MRPHKRIGTANSIVWRRRGQRSCLRTGDDVDYAIQTICALTITDPAIVAPMLEYSLGDDARMITAEAISDDLGRDGIALGTAGAQLVEIYGIDQLIFADDTSWLL